MNKPQISVVICTYNRANYLSLSLKSLINQTADRSSFEVIVVDNGSADHTLKVAEQFLSKLQYGRYVNEPQIGLSHARNRGIQEAHSSLVAFLDDDAQAATVWVEALLSAFIETVPQPYAVGGPVLLDWDGDPPIWLPRKYWSLYSFVNYGETPKFLETGDYIVGANMAFRRDGLVALGGFDTNLGRQATSLLSGEEADVIQKLHSLGLPVFYEPRATVNHYVLPERRSKYWLCRRMFWDGASQPAVGLLNNGHRDQPYPIVNHLWLDVRSTIRLGVQILLPSKEFPVFLRFLFWVQRLGRLRTHLLWALKELK